MKLERCFLDPRRKLTDATADWLCGEGRLRTTPEGVKSLAHLMVVVPTAQSGRNLRMALARKFSGSGVIPPRIVLPMQLVVPADKSSVEATDTETAAVFQRFIESKRGEILSPDGARVVKFTHLFTPDAFNDLTARFALLDQLDDIWRILSGDGLLMRDVLDPERCGGAAAYLENESLGDEIERWRELAELETEFFGALHSLGLRHRAENIRDACLSPARIPDEIECLVLPALADPVRALSRVFAGQRDELKVSVLLHADPADSGKFDEFGRPKTSEWTASKRPWLSGFANDGICGTPTDSAMADIVAADFPDVDSDSERPALALCDETAFPELSAAFLNRGYTLHNPEKHRLAESSLGALVRNLARLFKPRREGLPWKAFTAALRSDDVLSRLAPGAEARACVLEGIDVAQNNFIPRFLPPDAAFPDVEINPVWKTDVFNAFTGAAKELLGWLSVARGTGSIAGYMRSLLGVIFSGRRFSDDAEDGEFRAAAGALRELLDGLSLDSVSALKLSPDEETSLFLRELDAAVYSLEPDTPDSLKTEGWLELAWSTADHVALVGFHEGRVPASVTGHPFLPDALRGRLGLVTNDDRLARDTWLFKELLESHGAHEVRAYIARTNDAGDIHRPSRLLYLCPDAELPGRARRLFGEMRENRVDRARRVAPGWELRLPDSVPMPAALSPSRIDDYVKCPFTYLLKHGMGMKPYEDKVELEANDFGTLVHLALEMYAKAAMSHGDAQPLDAAEIRATFNDVIFPRLRKRYGSHPSLNLKLQLDAIESRIGLFADVQSEWSRAGWRIREAELPVKNARPFESRGERTAVNGVIDRVDQNVETGLYRIIDYKTWDDFSTARTHVYFNVSTNEGQRLAAERFGYPVTPPTLSKDGNPKKDSRRFASVQLPLYARCLELSDPVKYAGKIGELCYLVLGRDAGNVDVFSEGLVEHSAMAVETALRAIRGIRANVFWPPGPSDEWKYDFGGLFVTDPVTDIGNGDWAAGQARNLELLRTGGSGV